MSAAPTFQFGPPGDDPRQAERRDSAPESVMAADARGMAFEGLHGLEPGALGPADTFDVASALESEEPLFDDLELPVCRGLDAARWLAVERTSLRGVRAGEVLGEDDALVWFDSREEVALLVEAAGELYLLCALRGYVSVWPALVETVTLAPMPAMPASVAWSPPPLLEWLEALGMPDWLREACVERVATGDATDVAVALGLAGRLGRPARKDAVGAWFDRSKAWAAEQPPEAFAALLSTTLDLIDDGVTTADELVFALGEDDGDEAELVHGLILDRDDLESLTWVLNLRGLASKVRRPLDHLDRRCALNAVAIDDVLDRVGPAPGGQRWLEVAWREPEAWWVALEEDDLDEDA